MTVETQLRHELGKQTQRCYDLSNENERLRAEKFLLIKQLRAIGETPEVSE